MGALGRVASAMTLLCLSLLPGCSTDSSSPSLPKGSWKLTGKETLGELVVRSGEVTLSLWGRGWCTPPSTRLTLESETPSDPNSLANTPTVHWGWVPVTTGMGAGELAVAIHMQERYLIVPLGARAGEIDLKLMMEEGSVPDKDRSIEESRCASGLEKLTSVWLDGRFRVHNELDQLAGSLQLHGQNAPILEFYDPSMATDGPVPARQQVDGPDIVLTFPVEPSLMGEPGQIRVNIPTGRVVIPAGPEPTSLDRWWRLKPGMVAPDEAEKQREKATRESVQRERESIARMGSRLATDATRRRQKDNSTTCPAFDQMGDAWHKMLEDYDVSLIPVKQGCQVELVPRTVQHTRRLKVRLDERGILSAEPLGIPPQ